MEPQLDLLQDFALGLNSYTFSPKLSRTVASAFSHRSWAAWNQRKEKKFFQQRAGITLPLGVGLIDLLISVFTAVLVALLFTVGLVAQDAGAGFQPCRCRLPEVGRRVTRVPFVHHTKINAPGSVEQAWTA